VRAARYAIAAALLLLTAAPVGAQTGVLVMPFENLRRDPRIFWLGEASAVLLTDDVNALGGDAVTRQERKQAFARLKVPPAAVLTDATLIRIGQVVGAAEIVVGTLQLDGDVLTVRARTIALDKGRVQADITERGPMGEMFATFERVARRLAPPSTKTPAEILREHPPVDVFANFIKGLLSESPQTAINYLWTALKLQPSFERARLALWDVYANQNDYGHALDAVAAIGPGSPYTRHAQFLSGIAKLELKQYEDAFKIFTALAEGGPTAPVLNNLGVVQMRRFAPAQTGQPAYFFFRAAKADPDDSDYAFNLGYSYWLIRDIQPAIYWLREAVRRNRADADAHFVLGTALAASGNGSEAVREHELARRLSSEYEELDKRKSASNMVEGVPRGLERVKPDAELPRSRRIETRLAASEQRDQEDVARFHLDRGRRLYQLEHDRDALLELDRALYLSPYLAEAHLLLGRIHLRNGRVQDAIDAFKISLWSAETADVHVSLGEAYRQMKDLEAARVEARRALALDPASADAKQLLARIEGK
jgi:tetratricopeptide (TPR) repeat protein